jgi:hypothetical protein
VNENGMGALNNEAFSVYPNPSDNMVYWTSARAVNSYCIYGVEGKIMVKNTEVKAKQFGLSLENLSAGVYILTCTFDNGAVSQAYVIKK